MGFLKISESGNTMKTIFSLTFSALLAMASASITCDQCLSFTGKVAANMAEEKSIADQIDLLVSTLCPMTQDPVACDDGLRTYWPEMASIIYSTYLDSNKVCGQLGLCGFKLGLDQRLPAETALMESMVLPVFLLAEQKLRR